MNGELEDVWFCICLEIEVLRREGMLLRKENSVL